MNRVLLSSLLLICAMFLGACGKDVGCVGGECANEEACAEECATLCNGEVIDSICGDYGICSCECELGCK